MENASKALIMIAGVLIALMILSAFVFMYNQLHSEKNEELQGTEVQKMIEYNKKFEVYNRKILYGSDILSVANLVEDYNKLEVEDEQKKYKEIKVYVKIERDTYDDIGGRTYGIMKKTYMINEIKEVFISASDSITAKITELETNYNKKNKKSLSYLSDLQLRNQNKYEEEVKNNSAYGGLKKVDEDIEKYGKCQSLLKEFKLKIFSCTNVEYDQNGRIVKMEFLERTK